MNAQTPYELYRVITDYEALQDGFLDRIEDLNTTLEQIELAGELPKGYAAKLLCKSQKRVVKALGPHSLGKMLKGTGLVLALVVDDARFGPIKEQLVKRRRVNSPANAGKAKPAWLFTKKKAREMGKKRFSLMTPEQRKRHQRKAQKASAKSRRLRSRLKQMQAVSCNHRQHGALLAEAAPAQSFHGQSTPNA